MISNDGSNKSIVKTDFERWQDQGFCFQYNQIVSIPDAGTANKYFLFNPAGVPNENRISVLPLIFINVGDGAAYVNYYVGGNYTGGTPLVLYNRNAESLTTPDTVVYENPTGDTRGLKTSANKISIGGVLPSQTGGGSSREANSFIASNQFPILIEIVNQSGATTDGEVYFGFCEVPRNQI